MASWCITQSKVHDSIFNFGTAATNTYDGVLIQGTEAGGNQNSSYNVFSGNVFKGYGTSIEFKYGYEESVYADHNVFATSTGQVATGILRTTGTNDKYDMYSLVGNIATS